MFIELKYLWLSLFVVIFLCVLVYKLAVNKQKKIKQNLINAHAAQIKSASYWVAAEGHGGEEIFMTLQHVSACLLNNYWVDGERLRNKIEAHRRKKASEES